MKRILFAICVPDRHLRRPGADSAAHSSDREESRAEEAGEGRAGAASRRRRNSRNRSRRRRMRRRRGRAAVAESDRRRRRSREKRRQEVGRQQPARTAVRRSDRRHRGHVDVARRQPDGNEIAFDLLGDIYTIPIERRRGEGAHHGIAWDMQPRYSPNGKWIAFTSDRAGGDNIWIMNRDGSKPQQVTKETFRLLNEPTGRPTREYIVARKHFTAERSLGAGEIWLYHRSGGEGLQLTKKRTDQKDTGEPAFSPDGRYLYYSDDTTPGAIFQYNKDPEHADLRHPAPRPADRRDRAVRHRAGRLDASDAVAGRQVARVHPARPLQVDALHPRPRVGQRDADLRRPRSRHAGDVGDPRRLSDDGVDARQQVDRLLGRRATSAASTSRRRRSRRSRSTSRHAPASRKRCASDRGRAVERIP